MIKGRSPSVDKVRSSALLYGGREDPEPIFVPLAARRAHAVAKTPIDSECPTFDNTNV